MGDWIQEQLAAGKKEKVIIDLLKARGWTEEDAKRALASHAPPTAHLEKNDIRALITAMLGILLFTWFTPFTFGYGRNIYATVLDQVLSDLAPAAMLIVALLVIGWTLYDFAIRHRHPHLHRAYFLWAALVIGTAVFMWLAMLTSLLLQLFDVTLGTVGFLAFASIYFAASIVAMEFVYNRLRNRYDGAQLRSPKRLAIVGAIITVLTFIILLIAAYFAFNSFVNTMDNMREQMIADAEIQLVDEEEVLAVPNSYLRERLISPQHPSSLQRVSFSEILTSDAVANRCDDLYASFFWQNAKVFHYRLALQYREYYTNGTDVVVDLERYRSALAPQRPLDPQYMQNNILGVQYTEVTKLQTCFWQRMETLNNLPLAPFPLEPDLGDADQANLVKFVLWREELRAEEERLKDEEYERIRRGY